MNQCKEKFIKTSYGDIPVAAIENLKSSKDVSNLLVEAVLNFISAKQIGSENSSKIITWTFMKRFIDVIEAKDEKLKDIGFDQLVRISRKQKFFSTQKLLLPCLKDSHYFLVAIENLKELLDVPDERNKRPKVLIFNSFFKFGEPTELAHEIEMLILELLRIERDVVYDREDFPFQEARRVSVYEQQKEECGSCMIQNVAAYLDSGVNDEGKIIDETYLRQNPVNFVVKILKKIFMEEKNAEGMSLVAE